jgi:hypothetical protein
MAVKYDIKMMQGDEFEKKVQWKDVLGVVIPVTGMKAIFCVKYRDANGAVALLLTTENGGITLDTVNNKYVISADSAKTDLINKDELVYTFKVIDSTGNDTTLFYGKVKLIEDNARGI